MSFQFTSSGLKNISETQQIDIKFKDFEYQIGIIRAQFLSKKIKPNDQEFIFPYDDKYKAFSYIIELLDGAKLEIPDNVKIQLGIYGEILENDELKAIANTIELNPSNSIPILKDKHSCNLDISNEIKYIASHLFEMDEDAVKSLDIESQYLIFASPDARIENESWKFGLIAEQVRESDEYIKLFETVDFGKIGMNEKETFLQLVPISKCTQNLYEKLVKCVSANTEVKTAPVQKVEKDDGCFKVESKENGSLKGIINYLTEKCGGNVHKKGVIDVTSSSTFITFSPDNLCNYDSTRMYQSLNEENSWVKFDFKESSVKLSAYTIVSKDGKTNDHHLKSWVIEGSNDGEAWTVIDNEKDNVDLNGPLHKKTFEVVSQEFFSKIRLRMTSVAHSGYWALAASALEFFGSLKEK